MTAPALVAIDDAVQVQVRASPFRIDVRPMFAPPGRTIAELVDQALPDPVLRGIAQAWMLDLESGEPSPIPRPIWHRVRPKPGTILHICPVPQGGGGGNKVVRTVLTLAIVVAAAVVAPYLAEFAFTAGTIGFKIAAGLIGAAITGIGGLITNGLLGSAGTPRLAEIGAGAAAGGGALGRSSPTLNGSSNAARPWSPVPRIYGRHRVTPPKAARDVTESEGETTWLRCLFDFGYGPLALSDFRIGTTPIAEFEGVEMEVRNGYESDPPVSLYTNAIRQDAYSLKVTAAGGPQIIETRDNTVEVGIDVSFPALFDTDANGRPISAAAGIRIETRPVGSSGWILAFDVGIAAATTGSYTQSYRFQTVPGRHEVRVTRTTPDDADTARTRTEFFITALRSVQPFAPVRAKGRCLVALRIRATDQLNGTIQDFSAVAEAIVPVWSGSAWVLQTTRNPAWAYLDVLRGRANRFPVADARLSLSDFVAWAARCETLVDGAAKHTCDLVVDSRSTVFETLRDIAACGRAAPAMRDGKFSIVEDLPQTVPIQHFTPRNSWGFSGAKIFSEAWHGLRVRFIDPDRDWQQNEVVIYADGYTEATATRIDILDLLGCTRRAQAMREGRYHLAAATLRPETFELNCDIENLLCTRGDLVRVSHDVILVGSGWGRVKSLVMAGPDVAGFVLDELVAIAPDRSYAARWRTAAAADGLAGVSAEPGEEDTFTFAAPRPVASSPAAGDLVMIGESGRETVALLVKSIEPGPDLSAKLTLVDAAPAVHSADSGLIPAFDPLLTLPVTPRRGEPLPPIVSEIFSGTAALVRAGDGTVMGRVGLRLRPALAETSALGGFQVRWRRLGATDWEVASGPGPVVFTGALEDGETVEVAARAVAPAGLASLWTDTVTHLVLGKSALPGDVTNFTIAGRRLDWQAVPDLDLAGYRIRWAPGNSLDWGGAAPAHGGLLTASPFDLDLLPAGPVTILIKAVDQSGNESEAAARIVTDLGDPALEGIAAAATDLRAGAFPGVYSGATIVSGDLLADLDASAPMWQSASALMWSADPAAMFDDSVFAPLVYTAALAFASPPPGSRIVLAYELEGASTAIAWRGATPMWTADGDPMWTTDGAAAFGGDLAEFLPWPGRLVDPPAAFELRISIPGGIARGAIRRLVVTLEAPRLVETLADVAIASGGTRLPIGMTYTAISAVQLTLQGGTGARTASVVDKNVTLGPLISVVDSAGAGIAASVDATITGY